MYGIIGFRWAPRINKGYVQPSGMQRTRRDGKGESGVKGAQFWAQSDCEHKNADR